MDPWLAATLPPGNIPGPSSAAHVVMGNTHSSLRSQTGIQGPRSPVAYLSTGTVVCFSDSGRLFNPVIVPASSDIQTRHPAFDNQTHPLIPLLWPTNAASLSPSNPQFQHISWADPQLYLDGTTPVCQMFRFVTLPTPVMLPYGPLCSAAAGFTVFQEAVQNQLGPTVDLSWLTHPLLVEFTNACRDFPNLMSTHWISRQWITDAIGETSTTPGWEHPCDCDLWMQTERTLAFRLHHDFLLTSTQLSSTVKKSYSRYVQRAYTGDFTVESPLAYTPLALAGPLYFIRPPKVKAWDTKLHLAGWMVTDSVAPSTRMFLTHPVACGPNDYWTPIPLETEDDARDRMEEEAAGEREPSDLATARLAALGKRNSSCITQEASNDSDAAESINAFIPRAFSKSGPGLASQPISVDSPIRPMHADTRNEARQVSFAALDGGQPYSTKKHQSDIPYDSSYGTGTSRSSRASYIDTNRHGHLTSPVRPSTGFFDRYDGQNRAPNTSTEPDPGFTSLRRSLYDSSDTIPPAVATTRRIPTGCPSQAGTGYYQYQVTPTHEWHETPDSNVLRLPPSIGHRSAMAPVSQWRLDTSVTGQPESYVFLCALLFLRDVGFTGSSIDAQSGGFCGSRYRRKKSSRRYMGGIPSRFSCNILKGRKTLVDAT
jgi:hypothetical protein